MPYRRLPTTDKARLRALETALNKVNEISVKNIPFAKHSIEELQSVKNQFENTLKHYELNINQQSDNNKKYKEVFETARLYLSHFMQVLLFASERGEINGGIKYYGNLNDFGGRIPSLTTEREILEWGKIMVDGEQKRVREGGSAIYSPSIALVKFKLEEFNDAAIFQQNLKRNTLRTFEKMQTLRKTTNEFISQLWTEIENHLELEAKTAEQKRELAEEFGIVYVLRRKERKLLQQQKTEIKTEIQQEEKTESVEEPVAEIREEAPARPQFVQRDLFQFN
ncbi:hypothetical protein [Maribellus sediminis]|uniref:hypothetical protein n=1 Tax=Maribellus sediminis TaxID=2696285 RepID=UPI00142FE565|nr:hypothetical protein [Maribellus sediminis]